MSNDEVQGERVVKEKEEETRWTEGISQLVVTGRAALPRPAVVVL